MLDPFIQKALDKIKDANNAPAYQEQVSLLEKHLAFVADKLAHAEKEQAKLESRLETSEQIVADLNDRLATFDGKARIVDIGPCCIKENKNGEQLNGVYCPQCFSHMKLDSYHEYMGNKEYCCQKCAFMLDEEPVKQALAFYSKA